MRRALRRSTCLRAGLVFLTIIQGVLGAWTLLLPRTFYDHVPTVAMDPPFSEHPFRDFGASTLAMAVVLGAGALFMERRLVCTGLVAYLVFAVPHLAFHAAHLEHYPTGEGVVLVMSLALPAALPLILLPVALRPISGISAQATARPRVR